MRRVRFHLLFATFACFGCAATLDLEREEGDAEAGLVDATLDAHAADPDSSPLMDGSNRPALPDAAGPECPRPCFLSAGVCAGSIQACEEATCNYGAHSAQYVPTETSVNCDRLDNDCDGLVDEECDCQDDQTAACGGGRGVCNEGLQTCIGGRWGACEGEGLPSAEACNGLDDDCDGVVDESLVATQCENQRGVCAGAVAACGGERGFLACDDDRYNRNDPRYSPTETALNCDGEDNDCDGQTDETCECRLGETQACGQDVGECRAGEQPCVDGSFGACSGRGPAEETCNGRDDDCDRAVDEAARCGGDEACERGECQRVRWIYEAESGAAGHDVGRRDGNGWSASTDVDPAGVLLFGPYTREIPAGNFVARFRMQVDVVDANNDTVVRIEVNDFDGRAPDCGDCIIARQDVRRRDFAQPRQDQDFGLGFANPGGRRLEFRVYWTDRSYVRVDRVEVVRR